MGILGDHSERSARRWAEWVVLFLGIPIGLASVHVKGTYEMPIIPILIGLAVVMGTLLSRDQTFRWREAFALRWSRAEARRVFLRFVVLGLPLTALVAWQLPDKFLNLPRERTQLWLLVMVGYPVLSVVPQEFLYRTFFFHRYARLFGQRMGPVAASAICFGLAHLLFGNWIAVALTVVGGALFSSTYVRSKSLWLASLEHALFGQLVFTIGLGEYFYGGTIRALGGQ